MYTSISMICILKRRERTWKTAVPREKGSMERFKDKYVTTKLTYINERAYKGF